MQEEKNVSFERAKVEYNGAPDLYVDYVIVKANGQEVNYYLLNDQRIEKGHGLYIVSTNLKEAVDASVPRSHIGIIDDKANVVIPCNNKTVKVIDGKFLLVVRNEPETDSVKEAVLASKDQSATEKMVNANATIKDKVNKEMGSGKFILNDLLSEGTIYSLDGENLLDGKYYSFIGMNDHSFYLATNVSGADVEVVGFDGAKNIIPPIVQPDGPVLPALDNAQPLDVSSVSVPKEDIDEALEKAPVEEVPAVESSTEATPAVETPIVETSEVSVETTPVKEVPAVENSTEPTPAVEASSLETPEVSAETAPVEKTPEVSAESTLEDAPVAEEKSEEQSTEVQSEVGPENNVEEPVAQEEEKALPDIKEETKEVVSEKVSAAPVEEKNEPINLVPATEEKSEESTVDGNKFEGVVATAKEIMTEVSSLKDQVSQLESEKIALQEAKAKAEEEAKELPAVREERDKLKALCSQYEGLLSSVSSILEPTPEEPKEMKKAA